MADAISVDPLPPLVAWLRERLGGIAAPLRAFRPASTVATLARDFGLSPRGLHARLSAQVGVRPKLALRIGRLHTALEIASRGVPWVEIATRCGYSDQAHLTREASLLLGESPARSCTSARCWPRSTRGCVAAAMATRATCPRADRIDRVGVPHDLAHAAHRRHHDRWTRTVGPRPPTPSSCSPPTPNTGCHNPAASTRPAQGPTASSSSGDCPG